MLTSLALHQDDVSRLLSLCDQCYWFGLITRFELYQEVEAILSKYGRAYETARLLNWLSDSHDDMTLEAE